MDATAPDIAGIAGLMGDRARAAMLVGLMTGRPLTAGELARTARVTKQTASSHLARLVEARLVAVENTGRHRYFRLAHHEVAVVIEHLMGLAQRVGATVAAPGPPNPGMRRARVCYDHLAGELGVLVFDGLVGQGMLRQEDTSLVITEEGGRFFRRLGIDVPALSLTRRPLCLACLDWSVRRSHLAGSLGAALLDRCFELGWARRARASRTVVFSASGERALRSRFQAA